MALADEVYPFATQNGNPVPLDIIKPLSLAYLALTTSFATIVLDATTNLAMIWASEDAVIDLANSANALTSGTVRTSWIFIPKGSVVAASINSGTVRARTLSAASGNLMIQGIQKWSMLALPRQLNIKTS